MKKKLLSSAALAALVNGTVISTAAIQPGANAGGEPTTPSAPTEGATPTEGASPAADNQPTEDTQPTASEQLAEVQAELAGKEAELTGALARITELEAKVEEIASLQATADARVKAASEEAQEYRGIVVGQITTMRTALNLAAVDLTNWTNEAVLREYSAIYQSFEKAFSDGSKIPEVKPAEQKLITTSDDARGVRQLGF